MESVIFMMKKSNISKRSLDDGIRQLRKILSEAIEFSKSFDGITRKWEVYGPDDTDPEDSNMYKYPDDDDSGYHFYAEVREFGHIWISGQAEEHREGCFSNDKKILFHSRNHGYNFLNLKVVEIETCTDDDCNPYYYSDEEEDETAKRLWTCSITKSRYPNHQHKLF